MILYGSYGNNTQVDGSDIDIVIISKDFKGKTFWERIDIMSDVIYDIFAPIEAAGMTTDEWERAILLLSILLKTARFFLLLPPKSLFLILFI